MIRKSQLILAAVLVVVASGVVSYAVSASMPQALLPAGTTRYAVKELTASTLFLTADEWKDVLGASQSITVPAGKKADLIILFCGQADSAEPTSALQLRAYIGGSLATPSYTNFQEEGVINSHCALFSKTVGQGTKTVHLEGHATNGYGDVFDGQMLVIANIH